MLLQELVRWRAIWAYNITYPWLVLLNLRLLVRLVHVGKILDVGELVDLEGVLRVECEVVHRLLREHGVVVVAEGYEHVTINQVNETMSSHRYMYTYAPFALVRGLIPRHEDILGLDGRTFLAELLHDLGQQPVLLRAVDNRDAIHDDNVVKTVVGLDLVPGPQVRTR
jgi:hypothetical protein